MTKPTELYPAHVFSEWPRAECGPAPTHAMLSVAHAFATRGAGLQALVHAMSLRPEGVTSAQMLAAVAHMRRDGKPGTPQRNHMRGLVEGRNAPFTRDMSVRGYKLVISDAGLSHIKGHAADTLSAADSLAKPKAAKPRAVKAAPAVEPAAAVPPALPAEAAPQVPA